MVRKKVGPARPAKTINVRSFVRKHKAYLAI
jgi:hypothetical protein